MQIYQESSSVSTLFIANWEVHFILRKFNIKTFGYRTGKEGNYLYGKMYTFFKQNNLVFLKRQICL